MPNNYLYLLGLASVKNDQQYAAAKLTVEAKKGKGLPDWLSGRLLRNGPGLFDVEAYKFRHLFDGMAMIAKFDISNGQIFYSNRFLESDAYQKSQKLGRLAYKEFATSPYHGLLDFLASVALGRYSDNAAINIAVMDERAVALNEALVPVEFRTDSLDTVGDFEFDDNFSGIIETAHPQYDFANRCMINFATDFSLESEYKIFIIKDGTRVRDTITKIRIEHPGYMHSFAVTENYIILAEYPLIFTNALEMLEQFEQPMLNDYQWSPERGTRFYVIRKSDGKLVRKAQSESFMAWHHVNAFEQGNDIFLDICTYKDQNLVDVLYFDRLLQVDGGTMPPIEFRRYQIREKISDVEAVPFGTLPFDMPRINYKRYSAKDYTYAYGWGYRADKPNDFYNQLVKTDVKKRQNKVWFEDDCYPGEPIFVARPGATAEDDGVVLTVVLDGKRRLSFLLIQDAQSFDEIARAYLPHILPFGFHGLFTKL